MKNLKKILMAFVLVALLVSSVVTIAIADASYKGNVETAQHLLDAVYAAEAETGSKADAKAPALKSLYDYLITVNPQDEGYAEIREAYNTMTFKVMYTYYGELAKASNGDQRATVLTKVHTYKTSTPVIGNVNDVDFAYGFVCETCGEYRAFEEFEFFNGLATKDLKCPGKCSANDQKLSYTTDPSKIVSYVDFEKDFNTKALDNIEELVAYLFSLEEISSADKNSYASYYDLKASRAEVEKFLAEVLEKEYKPATSVIYTGSVADASAKLRGTTTSSDFAKIKGALASAYGYLIANPVNPTSDEFYKFIENYNTLSEALISNLAVRVAACTTPDDKFAELADFRAYLMENLISEYVVNQFNALRLEMISEYGSADEIIQGLEAVDAVAFVPSYCDALEDFAAKLDAVDAALAADGDIKDLLIELYSSYASAFAYNPAAEGYSALIDRYIAICEDYVAETFTDPIANADLVTEKLAVLVEFHGFVAANPLSESVVDKYNEARNALSKKLSAYTSMIVDNKLPVYVAPEKENSTASAAVLESFLKILTDSVDKYSSAEGENKLAALKDMETAAAELRAYILGVNLDDGATYYADFVADYEAARDAVTDALISYVDSAEGDDVVPALETVKAFLVEAPLTRDAINRYNAKVAELVADTDDAAALVLASAYDEIDALIADVNEADNVGVLRELGVKLYALSANSFDTTDPAYSAYLESYTAAMDKIAGAIYSDIIASLNESNASDDAALVDGYLKYASEVYVESIVTKTTEAIKAVKNNFSSVNAEITTSNENAAAIESLYANVIALIEEFDSASDVYARAEAFKALFVEFYGDSFNTVLISGKSYAAIAAEYDRILLAMETELIAMLNADVSAYNLAKNIEFVYNFILQLPFSDNVIDEYNAVYEEVSSADFGTLVDGVDAACPAVSYKTPEGWNPNLSRINIAISLSIDENGLVEDKFEVAYKILAGEIGVNGPQVIDFGVAGFREMITSFADVKQNIVDKYSDMLAAAGEMDEKREILDELGAFIDKYPFSGALVDGYNQIRKELRSAYSQDTTTYFTRFQSLVNKVYERIESCPIDSRYLTNYQKSIYNVGQKLLSAAEFSILENYLEIAMSISGPNALIYQNIAVDELNASIGSFELGSYNEKLLAEANLEFAFIKFIEKFDAELEALSANEKAAKIESTGSFMVVKEFPSYLIALYNSKYGTSFNAASIDQVDTPANIIEYADILKDIMLSENSSDARLALVDLVSYVNTHKFSTEDTSGDMSTKLNTVKEELAKATAEQKAALDKLASSDESSLPVIMEYNFDTTGTSYKPASTYGTFGYATANIETVPGTSNKAIKFSSDGTPQFNHKIASAENGLVLDFDIMSPVDQKLNMDMYFYGDSNQYIPFKFVDGVLQNTSSYDNFPAGSAPITATPGQWMHLTIVIDYNKGVQELLVDYVSIGKTSITVPQARLEGAAALRVHFTKATFYIDNWNIYQGTAYRTLGQIASATDDEKFVIYLNTLFNEEAKATDRLAAFYSAQSVKPFVSDECADLVAELNNFDITDIKAAAEAIHLAKVKELVAKATSSAKQADIDAANNYIDTNRLYIDQTSPEFRSCTQALIDAADKIVWHENLDKYIAVLAKFHRATSYASLTKHLESVTYYYNLCELYEADKIAEAATVAAAVTFSNQMKADASATALVPDVSFANYYTVYIPARLAAQTRYENSVKAVDCIALIESLVENKDQLAPDAYKAALLAAAGAEENFEFVDSYLAIVRKIVVSGEYDEAYAGIDYAIEVYELLNPMFFDAAQQRHFEHIEAQFVKYRSTNSYIERAGICAYIRNYIEANDVSMTSDEGLQILYALQMYEDELVNYKSEYEAILAANTESFIGMVKKMQAYVTYSELKPLYDEAIANYYYSMNVDSKEAQAAIAIFLEYEKMIQDWEENSAMLLVYAKDLKNSRMAQKFRALVRCAAYVDGADAGVSAEVEAAIKLYAKTFSEYMDMINPIINETADATNVVSALRTNRLSSNVLAMANAIINN